MASSQQPTVPLTIPGKPPSAQEIQRKLSATQRKGKSRASAAQSHSGTDTEDESSSVLINEPTSAVTSGPNSQPLSAIAERTTSGAEESEEDEEEDAGGWRPAKSVDGHAFGSSGGPGVNLTDLHSGYLWKKGSGRRKTWKRRWFVLRPTHLACYKTSAEYKLLRLLDISDIHAATPVQLKRHPNTCGIVTQGRTFYFQAETASEIDDWVVKINAAKDALHSSGTPVQPVVASPSVPVKVSVSQPDDSPPSKGPTSISIAIPTPSPTVVFTEPSSPMSASASPRGRNAHASNTSSDSDEGAMSAGQTNNPPFSPARETARDNGKPVLSGYLMKCGGRRKIWRKRWFILTQSKLVYMSNHMDSKPHRQVMLNQILDAMEYRPSSTGQNRHVSPNRPNTERSPASAISPSEGSTMQRGTSQSKTSNQGGSSTEVEPYRISGANFTFKVITTKKTFLLCAPSEEEEVNWISAIRALIARRTKDKDTEVPASAAPSSSVPLASTTEDRARVLSVPPSTGAPKSATTVVGA